MIYKIYYIVYVYYHKYIIIDKIMIVWLHKNNIFIYRIFINYKQILFCH